ncbi:hypothetical protein FQN53_008694 [Emmonsiellopsis sp. PD_33]|nr:hypothetical protein FQN53_008694 [Emmonsiellopsis sp. PD_33]
MDGSSNIKFFSAPSDFGDYEPENNEIPTTTPTIVEHIEEVIEIDSSPTPPTNEHSVDEHPADEHPADEHSALPLSSEEIFIFELDVKHHIDIWA